MTDDLLEYYERELTYLRQEGAEFAKKYPGEASRLMLDENESPDPSVERLLEGVAFLAGRVHRKLAEGFPQVLEGLLDVVYPHFLRSFPSTMIVQFELDEAQGISGHMPIPKGKLLYTRPAGKEHLQCRFKVCYETDLWPVKVISAAWLPPYDLSGIPGATDAVAGLRLRIETFPNVGFNVLAIPKLRFYIHAESRIAHTLYELISNNCDAVALAPAGKSAIKPFLVPASIETAGWSEHESLLPWPQRSFGGYRLLQEYFVLPEKFFFFDVTGLRNSWDPRLGNCVDLFLLFSPFQLPQRQDALRETINAGTFRLGCTPVVNLFSDHAAEPIVLDRTRHEYPVIADLNRRDTLEIFSIDEVAGVQGQTRETRIYNPLFSCRPGTSATSGLPYWFATRRPSTKKGDEGTEMFLSFVDSDGQVTSLDQEILTITCTCSNRDAPSQLLFGQSNDSGGDFVTDGTAAIQRILTLRKPTPVLRPTHHSNRLLQLVSHLSLNYMSLVAEGPWALQEPLRLYKMRGSAFVEKQVNAIRSVTSIPVFARVRSDHGVVFTRGTRVELSLAEDEFAGGGAWLFASVLDHFLGQYVSLNSFTQLAVQSDKREKWLNEWPPRAGSRIVV